ncbi:band 4.1-like protein 4 isoform X2 [Siniperca chuatsi]|uniref:band 4.1-like protein 4 isoform X2 n=1 Tax=Siniperca chuatsi TaxID=119488 RepID=UPI001CE05FCA|nr:band 4.1-like protein 4 isoform X2 [Siniperca chuatsi]
MMACFRGNREEFYGEVLLLDERKITLTAEQGIKKSSKAAAILQQVFSHLKVVEIQFFGLRFCDNKQQTHWLDPSKTLSQHRDLVGPPYIFYFGVRFYAEDPSKLKEETTRYQFYLQVRQDVRRGRLPCPPHLKPKLFALMLQERGDHSEAEQLDSEENHELQRIYKTLCGVSRPQAQCLLLSLCSSLQMFGVSLFATYGENQSEYFLGPTPVGVVIYKNKVLVGKYFWQRITRIHFKDQTFELRVAGKNGSETSFFFQTLDRSDCKRLWRCCVEHHVFFRMSESNPLTHKLKPNSAACSPTLPWLNVGVLRNKTNKTTSDLCMRSKHHTNQIASEPMMMQTAPPAVQRSEGGAEQDQVKPSAPWENSGPLSGLFNPKFPPNTKEEERDGGRPQRRSRSLDGDRPVRQRGRRSRSYGNTSSGSESEKTASNSEQRRRRTKIRGCPGDQRPDSTSWSCTRSRSPNVLTWKHIQKQLVEPDGLIDRQTEEIPYKEVRNLEQQQNSQENPTTQVYKRRRRNRRRQQKKETEEEDSSRRRQQQKKTAEEDSRRRQKKKTAEEDSSRRRQQKKTAEEDRRRRQQKKTEEGDSRRRAV